MFIRDAIEGSFIEIEWETLATGFLAIGAAFYTVRGMRAVDKQHQKRHDQLYALTLRADRLAVDRAVTRIDELETLRDYAPDISEYQKPEDVIGGIALFAKAATTWLSDLEAAIAHKSFEGVARFLDGGATLSFDMARRSIDDGRATISNIDRQKDYAGNFAILKGQGVVLNDEISTCCEAINYIVKDLKSLDRTYSQ